MDGIETLGEISIQTHKDAGARLIRAYYDSAIQQVANTALVDEILGTGIKWNTGDAKIDVEWDKFIQELVFSINVMGYAAYRVGIRNSGDINDFKVAFEVANPSEYVLRWDKKRMSWGIALASPIGWDKTRSRSKRWRLVIVHPPVIYDGVVALTSPAAIALASCEKINAIMDNAVRRDTHNSLPTVFTSVKSSISSQPWTASNRPWFNATLPQIVPSAPVAAEDFNTLVENRAETIQVLDELSAAARDRARKQYEQNTRAITGKGPTEAETPRHRELVVSDGREYQAAPALKSTEDIRFILDRLEETVLQAWGVPPMVIGRAAVNLKSGALSFLGDQSKVIFERKARGIRDKINMILRFVSTRASGRDDVYICIVPNIKEEVLRKFGPVMKESAKVSAIASLAGIEESDIDKKTAKDFVVPS